MVLYIMLSVSRIDVLEMSAVDVLRTFPYDSTSNAKGYIPLTSFGRPIEMPFLDVLRTSLYAIRKAKKRSKCKDFFFWS